MDKLKGMAEKAMHGGGGGQSASTNTNTNTGGQEDYGDKGVDAVEKKFGINMSREQNEKYTDQGREMFESKTGKKIPDKFSN